MSGEVAPSESPTPTGPASPRSAPGPRPRSTSRLVLAVVAVVVVAALVLSVLWLGGIFQTAGGGPGTTPTTFSEARTIANATTGAPGSWVLFSASGYASSVEATASMNLTSEYYGCTARSMVGPLPGNVTWPAFHGSWSNGTAMAWVFSYFQPLTPGALSSSGLVVMVTGGIVSAAFELSGPSCTIPGGWALTGPLGNVIDSPAAVQSAMTTGGSTFLKLHPTGLSMIMGVSQRGGWGVTWWTCSLFPDAYGWVGNGSQLTIVENSTTGYSEQIFNGTCGGPPPIEEGIGFGTPTLFHGSNGATLTSAGCTSMDYCYSVPISRVSLNVTPADLSLGVFLNNNGDNSVVGYAILNSAGEVVVSEYGTGTGAGGTAPWVSGVGDANTPLTTSMRLLIDMGGQNPAGAGYVLSVEGWGPSFALSPYFSTALP